MSIRQAAQLMDEIDRLQRELAELRQARDDAREDARCEAEAATLWRAKYQDAQTAGLALWAECRHDGPGICVHFRDLRVALEVPLPIRVREQERP